MIATQFDYLAPKTIDEAVALLAQHGENAKILAGGHSLVPAMKLRLAQPALVIDIGRIKDLAYIYEDDGHIRIGALTTHYEIESSDLLKRLCPLLPDCAATIGDVQVRNKGTLCGSVVHADPAADWPAAILALDAEMHVVSNEWERTIKAEEFFVDMLTTSIDHKELLREIRFVIPQGRVGQSYLKVHQPASGFAIVGVAVNLTLASDDTCESIRVGVTGVASKAYRAKDVENALVGQPLDEQTIANASEKAADGVDANADLHASAEYRCHLARVYTRRAIQTAVEKAK
jgi:carbon-monoxide dehydrogenase medium subunit